MKEKKHFLIVVDMQNDFVDGALGTPEAQAIVPKVAEKIRNFEGEIVVTLDTHGQDYLQTREGRFLPVPHCVRDSEGWKLNRAVRDALKEKNPYIRVEKASFADYTLPLVMSKFAQEEDFDVEMVGLCTDICVVSNAMVLKAAFPDIDITVDAACCAGVTPESHKAALLTMACCQICVINND